MSEGTSAKYWERNFIAMLFFVQSEDWSLLNFLKYLDSVKSLDDRSEAHHKYKLLLNSIKDNKEMSEEKRKKAEQALGKRKECWLRLKNPAIEVVGTRARLRLKNLCRGGRCTSGLFLDEASDVLVLSKRDNLRRLRSDFEIGDNIEGDRLKKIRTVIFDEHVETKTFNNSFDEFVDSGETSGETTEIGVRQCQRYGRNIRIKMEEIKRNKLAIAKDEIKAEYSAKYHKLRPENKWKLPSGKFVEDILYEYTINLDHESFIFDTSDEIIMNLFSELDQQHIGECNIPSEPQVDDTLLDFLLLYRLNNPQDLRRVINIDIDLSSYNPWRNYDYYYVHEVFSHLAMKNKGRKDSKVQKLVGRKCDGILRKLETPEEFAISEEGKLWDREDGTKFLADGFKKFPKTMRDTLVQKVKKFNLSFVISHQLEVVGFLHSGQYLQQLVMDIPCGSICRLRRFPTTKIPASLDEVDELIAMVNDMLIAKQYRTEETLEEQEIN
ncbi:9979_t:CDS:10 [Funneliformis geosporum]|uniref:16470_t:CDS:1 n=1 Tax=Funneliformis geosporum TaxID=1117311 RepID=A0A9W4T1Q8_9GLOM|nr:16470_t:CDS:10 [Funneliformis geosporum]CAI2189623.1 9979_t:CDS:10 [Funneliformis geosporum]